MFRVSENTNDPKKFFQTIAIILSLCISLNKIIAAKNQLILPKELFDNRIFCYAFQNQTSIDTLQQTYYKFSLLSQEYNQKTKELWSEHWFSIMEHVCAENRYTRMYFATRFRNIHEAIDCYYSNHIYLFNLVFDRNPRIQSLAPNLYGFGTQEARNHVTVEYIKDMDPNFTTYGQNGQMSFLECAIKSYSVYFEKIAICKHLIEHGAHYDIWIPGILKKERELASYKSPFSFFNDEKNTDKKFLKRMRTYLRNFNL